MSTSSIESPATNRGEAVENTSFIVSILLRWGKYCATPAENAVRRNSRPPGIEAATLHHVTPIPVLKKP
jgi:hypothetical protein